VSALRVYRAEQGATWRREQLALNAAAAGGIPVPLIEANGSWRERPALLLSWCTGLPLAEALARRPWSVWRLGLEFGAVQARINRLAAPAGLRSWEAAWRNWLGDGERALLERVRAVSRAERLLHLDYHPLNVMAERGRVSGVLDWANAAAGDPRLDAARTIAILRLAPAPPGAPPRLTALLRRLLELGWRRGYRRPLGPTADLAPFHAAVGAMMVADLAPKLGRPGVWLTQADLERIRRWAELWKRRSGL
jgi:phosphotransferase family enzyme